MNGLGTLTELHHKDEVPLIIHEHYDGRWLMEDVNLV